MDNKTKKYVYITPLVLLLLIFMIYAIYLGQLAVFLILPFAALVGIGIATFRLKYSLFF